MVGLTPRVRADRPGLEVDRPAADIEAELFELAGLFMFGNRRVSV
jgi:hypothetical protein